VFRFIERLLHSVDERRGGGTGPMSVGRREAY
jgi:hypothetical protein